MKKDFFDKIMDLFSTAAIVALAAACVKFVFDILPKMIESIN